MTQSGTQSVGHTVFVPQIHWGEITRLEEDLRAMRYMDLIFCQQPDIIFSDADAVRRDELLLGQTGLKEGLHGSHAIGFPVVGNLLGSLRHMGMNGRMVLPGGCRDLFGQGDGDGIGGVGAKPISMRPLPRPLKVSYRSTLACSFWAACPGTEE